MDKEQFRQSLINAKTPAESRLLYILLKDDYLKDKFEFQKSIGKYLADFCFEFKRLVVELDGSSHEGRAGRDRKRTKELKELGYNVIRFSNEVVFKRPDLIVRKIMMSRSLRRSKNFYKDHMNKYIFTVKGSKVIRRKKNPAVGRQQAKIDLL